MEFVLIYFNLFSSALHRFGLKDDAAFLTGVYLSCTALVSMFAIFCVKSVLVRWFLLFFAIVTLLLPAWEFARQWGEAWSKFQ